MARKVSNPGPPSLARLDEAAEAAERMVLPLEQEVPREVYARPPLRRYEYKRVMIANVDFEAAANEMGVEGWELTPVSSTTGKSGGAWRDGWWYVAKREVAI